MFNLSDPLYSQVIEPIIERVMEANDVGREYALNYINNAVREAVADLDLERMVDEAVANLTYDLEARIEDLETRMANNESAVNDLDHDLNIAVVDISAIGISMNSVMEAVDSTKTGNWFTRLFRK